VAESVKVDGLNELVRAFGKIDKDLRRDLQREISGVAKVVGDDVRPGERFRKVGRIRERVRGAAASSRTRREEQRHPA
jgi:hypothetical protein